MSVVITVSSISDYVCCSLGEFLLYTPDLDVF
jgi:hypothetical protein